jgi:hypothetical protein
VPLACFATGMALVSLTCEFFGGDPQHRSKPNCKRGAGVLEDCAAVMEAWYLHVAH